MAEENDGKKVENANNESNNNEGKPDEKTAELLKDEAVQKAIRDAVNAATEGLKANRDEVLEEKRRMQESLKKFENYDLEKIETLMQSIEKSDDAKMIAEGKFDEILEKRTEKIRNGFAEEIRLAKEEAEAAKQEIGTYKQQYEKKIIADDIRAEALKQGVRPEAINDVIARSEGVFVLEEGKTKVAKSDGYVDSVERFIKSLKDTASYYWPDKANFDINGNIDMSKLSDKISDAAEAGDFEAFKKLREARAKK